MPRVFDIFAGIHQHHLEIDSNRTYNNWVESDPFIVTTVTIKRPTSTFFQNEEIFVPLDELEKLDRFTHA